MKYLLVLVATLVFAASAIQFIITDADRHDKLLAQYHAGNGYQLYQYMDVVRGCTSEMFQTDLLTRGDTGLITRYDEFKRNYEKHPFCMGAAYYTDGPGFWAILIAVVLLIICCILVYREARNLDQGMLQGADIQNRFKRLNFLSLLGMGFWAVLAVSTFVLSMLSSFMHPTWTMGPIEINIVLFSVIALVFQLGILIAKRAGAGLSVNITF
jgi:hypothetical protein